MRLAVVISVGTRVGGAELLLRYFARHAAQNGVELLVVFLEDGPLVQEIRQAGADVEVIPAGRLRELHRIPVTVARLRRLLRRRRIDFVLAWMRKAQLYAAPAARLAGIDEALYHLEPPAPPTWLDRASLALPARGVICCFDGLARNVEAISSRRPVHVVKAGIDFEAMAVDALPSTREARRRLGIGADGPAIGIVARLQRFKGVHVLIAAMPRVLARHPDAQCVVVGGREPAEPDFEPYLHQLAAELGVAGHVTFAGFQPAVALWRQAFDVDVNASELEPFSYGVLEAMALGKPVIGGDRAPELIVDGVNGLVVPFGDADALAAAICRLLEEPGLAGRLGAAGRETVSEMSTENFARELVGVVDGLRAHTA